MPGILLPEIEHYLERLIPERPEPLRTMEVLGAEKGFPIIGPACGRVLMQLAAMIGAMRVLELGSGYGYSACWFALGMPEGGEIICTDGDPALREAALGYFKTLGRNVRYDFRVGNALDIIQELDGPFDIIFNDIDKHQYPATIPLVVPKLRSGGLFVTDNTLWSGQVARPIVDPITASVHKFNQAIFAHPELMTSIIPLRDGLAVSVKR